MNIFVLKDKIINKRTIRVIVKGKSVNIIIGHLPKGSQEASQIKCSNEWARGSRLIWYGEWSSKDTYNRSAACHVSKEKVIALLMEMIAKYV